MVNRAWPEKVEDDNLKPYFFRKNELTLEKGCLMWGFRIVIPRGLREVMLQELHVGHQGTVKMKALARSLMWWPGMDAAIEQICKSCIPCLRTRSDPKTKVNTRWPAAEGPWQRVHIDFLGPIQTSNFLIIVDAYSKWTEVFKMASTSSAETIAKLRETFARFGLPELLVSDNGPQLTSEEFRTFLKKNGINHVTSPTFFPASNGAAENAVKTFKRSINAALLDIKNKNTPVETLIARFLMAYRNTPHCTTNETPAKLMLGRTVKTRLECLKSGGLDQSSNKQWRQEKREFDIEDSVMIRDYRKVNKKDWAPAIVRKRLGHNVYLCQLEHSSVTWKRHSNQMIKYTKQLVTTGIGVGGVRSGQQHNRISVDEIATDQIVGNEESIVNSDNSNVIDDSIVSIDNSNSMHDSVRKSTRIRNIPERFGNVITH